MELEFNDKLIKEIRDDTNLILFYSKFGSMENMLLVNKLLEALKNVKIQAPHY